MYKKVNQLMTSCSIFKVLQKIKQFAY